MDLVLHFLQNNTSCSNPVVLPSYCTSAMCSKLCVGNRCISSNFWYLSFRYAVFVSPKIKTQVLDFFYHDSKATVRLSLLVIEVSRSHLDAPQLEGSSARMIDPSQRPLPNNTQHSQGTSKYPAGFEPAILTSK